MVEAQRSLVSFFVFGQLLPFYMYIYIFEYLHVYTGENGSLKVGILEYLVDGVIPFLHTYYSCYFDSVDAPSDSKRTREIDISSQIFSNLVVRF